MAVQAHEYLRPGDTTYTKFGTVYTITNPDLILANSVYPLEVEGDRATINWPPHDINFKHANRIWKWIQERDGLAIWISQDLGDPAHSMMSPRKNDKGQIYTKPHWSMPNQPSRIITDPSQVLVMMDEECRRFHVAVQSRRGGLKFECTPASSDKIKTAVEKAGKGASYYFDYDKQEAVITKPALTVTLAQWMALKNTPLFLWPHRSKELLAATLGPFPGYPAAHKAALEYLAEASPEVSSVVVARGLPPIGQSVRMITRETPPYVEEPET